MASGRRWGLLRARRRRHDWRIYRSSSKPVSRDRNLATGHSYWCGPPTPRIVCEKCGEGINFNREVRVNSSTLCRACAGPRYYEPLA
ncbi:MAG: TraR/DksA C4-type zinc finger protein [Candidatus Acidiferrales bacterium]